MRSPEGKLIGAGEFIPVAEKFGLMPLLDRWVVSHVFEVLARTTVENLRSCTINLSAQSLDSEAIGELLREAVRENQVDTTRVGFEVTETAALTHPERGTAFLQQLHAWGFRVAIDDFGAGMASFAYLRLLQADTVKIDGSFIRGRLQHPVNAAVIRAAVDIGHSCGMRVVAESVENNDDLEAVRAAGVDGVQGFGLHRPEPLANILARPT